MASDDPLPPDSDDPAPIAAPTRHRLLVRGAIGFAVLVLAGGATAIGIAVSSHHAGDPAGASALTHRSRPPASLRLVGISPVTHATGIAFNAPIELTFSTPLARHNPKPRIEPTIAGTWSRPKADELTFTPSANFLPLTVVHVFIPGGASGIRARDGARLAATIETGFTVQEASVARLQQLLAELDYLPVGFAPSGAGAPLSRAADALSSEPSDSAEIPLAPAVGSFVWRFPHTPAQLQAAFSGGAWGSATEGAVMAFQSEHDLAINGEPTNATWAALLQAVAEHKPTTRPYDYLLVTETLPETLYVWQQGKVVYQSPANTGVDGAATALGTFPVYSRFTVTTMSGYNPDGSHYVDPGIPWVSYFNGGDAVHGYVRPGYGYPQSDGCVELPIANAEKVYPLDPYGTLVTVTTGDLAAELGTAAPSEIAPPPPPTTTPSTTSTTTTTTTTVPPRKKRPRPHPTTTTSTTPSTTTTTSVAPSGPPTS